MFQYYHLDSKILNKQLLVIKKEYLNLKFQETESQLKSLRKIKYLKLLLSRIKTVLKQL